MDRVLERGAGLDGHKKTVTACVRGPGISGDRAQHVRTFGTTTVELLTLRDWLEAHRVTHVAMESTGVDWRPVFYVLEATLACILANAAWIAQLLECGLIRASFVPPPPIRELRALTRYRKLLIPERTRHANRLHQVLEDTGIKLTSVATRLLGASGRAMRDALVAGTPDPDVLADLARGTLRKKRPAWRHALLGHFRAPHAFLVSQLLAHLDDLDEAIETVSTQIDAAMTPFAEELARLDTIRGVNTRTAEVLLAELGPDMRVLPPAKHAASWAGLGPGNHESAGQHRSGRTRHGNRWLRAALIEAALAARLRSPTGAFAARSRRVRHRGHKKPIVAVAHAILVTAYHLLARQTPPRTPAPTTTTADMPSGSATGPFTRWNAKAIASRSNPQPEREVSSTGDFLSKALSQSFPQGGAGGRRRPGPTRPRWCAWGTGGVKDGTHLAASAAPWTWASSGAGARSARP
jgi:transposase